MRLLALNARADTSLGLKEFSKWPTFPQVYVDGELVGGLDIIKEIAAAGDLELTLPVRPRTRHPI